MGTGGRVIAEMTVIAFSMFFTFLPEVAAVGIAMKILHYVNIIF